MPAPREFIFGPWRAVSVLGVTEILAWGALVLSAGADRAADCRRSRLVAIIRDGRIFVGPVRRRAGSRYVGATIDRLGGHVVMPVGSLIGAAGLVGPGRGARRRRLFRGMDGARRRHGGLALRSGFRHARPHFRRRRAGADHDVDACRRFRFDRELAGDAISDRRGRLARHLSGLCRDCSRSSPRRCTPWRCRGSVSPIRRRRRFPPPSRSRRRFCRRAGSHLFWSLPALPPTPSCRRRYRRNCSPSSSGSGSTPDTVVAIGMLFGPAQVLARICRTDIRAAAASAVDRAFRRRSSCRRLRAVGDVAVSA